MNLWIMWISRMFAGGKKEGSVYKRTRSVFVIGICLWVFSFLPFFARESFANSDVPPKPIILLLIDGFSFHLLEEWTSESEEFAQWVKESDLGAMVLRTANGRSVQNQLLTLSTGVKERASSLLLQAVQDPKTQQIYLPYYDEVGLGEFLKQNQLSRFMIGNSDLEGELRRLGPLLLADKNGLVPKGDIRGLNLQDLDSIRSTLAQRQEDFVVIELGDLRRVFSVWDRTEPLVREEMLQNTKQGIISLVLWVDRTYGKSYDVWMVSPGVDVYSEERRQWLSPIIRHSVTNPSEGIFISPTTRQPGIISNVDFFPTILQHFGISAPLDIEGRTLGVLNQEKVQKDFLQKLEKVFYIHDTRPTLMYQVVSLQVILLLGTYTITYIATPKKTWALHLGRFALSYVLIVPFLLLILGIWAPLWKIWQIHLYLILGGLIVGGLSIRVRPLWFYRGISLLYVGILLLDGLLGNPMMKRSFLGYDPVIGARFYGIGNEYMGVLIGSALLFLFLSRGEEKLSFAEHGNHWGKVGIVLFMFGILLYLGLPNGGTNAGGTVAWLFAIFLVLRWLYPGLFTGGKAILAFAGIVSIFALLFAVQIMQGIENQTHIGLLFYRVAENPQVIFETMKRKWEMNIRLIKVSTWSKLFVTSLILLGWFLLQPKKKRKRNRFGDTIWGNAFRAIVFVSLVNLLVNDSGVVAAAMSLLFAVVPLLHMVMDERFASPPRQA